MKKPSTKSISAPRSRKDYERVVGLDLSLTGTGVCVLDRDLRVVCSATLGRDKLDKDRRDCNTTRMVEIGNGILDVVKKSCLSGDGKWLPTMFVFEGVHVSRYARTSLDLAELQGAIKVLLFMRARLEMVTYSVAKMRQLAFGDGKLSEEDIRARLLEMGYDFGGRDNEEDACVCALAYASPYKGPPTPKAKKTRKRSSEINFRSKFDDIVAQTERKHLEWQAAKGPHGSGLLSAIQAASKKN